MDHCFLDPDTQGIIFVASKFALISFPCAPDALSKNNSEVKISYNPSSFARSSFIVYAFGRITFL